MLFNGLSWTLSCARRGSVAVRPGVDAAASLLVAGGRRLFLRVLLGAPWLLAGLGGSA